MYNREKLIDIINDFFGCDAAYFGVHPLDLATHLIANGVKAPEWISPSETLPDPFVPVLICREKEAGKRVVEQGYKDLGKWWKVYGTRVTTIIGWMPLPQPPEGEIG